LKYIINKKANGPLYVTEQDEMKENANCPASEKTGEGPGSCGGSKGSDKNKMAGPKKGSESTSNSRELSKWEYGKKIGLGIHIPKDSKVESTETSTGKRLFVVKGHANSYDTVEKALTAEAVKDFVKSSPASELAKFGIKNLGDRIDVDRNDKWSEELEKAALAYKKNKK
jgi:hypothetical protein